MCKYITEFQNFSYLIMCLSQTKYFKMCIIINIFSLYSEIIAQPDMAEADLPYIMHMLNEEMDGFPPGGGITSK